MERQPYEECTRFERCSVNHCPLDPVRDERESFKDDPEPRCMLPKSRRMGIASRYPTTLPWMGLRTRELSGMLRWEAMTQEEQEEVKKRGKESLGRIATRRVDGV